MINKYILYFIKIQNNRQFSPPRALGVNKNECKNFCKNTKKKKRFKKDFCVKFLLNNFNCANYPYFARITICVTNAGIINRFQRLWAIEIGKK